MTESCAFCDADSPDRKVYPPQEWVEYLRRERGLGPIAGVLSIPLCGDCHSRVSLLRDAFREFEELDEDRRERTREQIESTLERLTLDALLDETGPDAEDRSRLDD